MSTQSESPPVAKAGFSQLTFMIYGAACGGAFGVEEMISGSGPGVAMLSMLVVPALFCIPIALAVAELTSAFPVEGGNYRWSRMAFGSFMGFQAAWWVWMTGVMTNVVFAVLFSNYLLSLIQDILPQLSPSPEVHWWTHKAICVALVWVMHGVNVLGIEVVGNASIVLTILLLIPFVFMTVLGLKGLATNPILPFVAPGRSFLAAFGSSMSLAIFLYSGYDKLSNVAEEVKEPQRTFPPALFLAVIMAVLSYTVPTLAALGALGNWGDWKASYFPEAARLLGGPWLARAMALAGMCSNALLLNVTMLAVSRVPLALAEDLYLPGFLSRKSPRFGTPVYSLVMGSILYSLCCLMNLDQVLVANSWFQMAMNMLIIANIWRLRRIMPEAPRPFLVPGGKPGLTLVTIAIWALAVAAIFGSVFGEKGLEPAKLVVGCLALVSGAVGYLICEPMRLRRWAGVDPRKGPREGPGTAP